MDENIKFLTALHAVSVKSHESVVFLENLINSLIFPSVIKMKLVEIQTTLKIQDEIIRKMGEQQVDVADKLEEVAQRFDPRK